MKRFVFVILLCTAAVLSSAQTFDYPIRVVKGVEVYEYPVQKGEGLYRISVNFGVTQEELIKFNPELKTSGLKLGQVILVPVKNKPTAESNAEPKSESKSESKSDPKAALKQEKLKPADVVKAALGDAQLAESQPVEPQPAETNADTDTVPAVVQTTEDEVFFEEDTMFVMQPEQADSTAPVLRLALLLPLQADAQTYDVKMERFLKFYEGILLALREVKRDDIRYEVFVYDIGKTEYKLQRVLEQDEMSTMHAIIGPAYANQIPAASAFVKKHEILCLLPFTNGVEDLETNKYLLQYNPTVPEGMRIVQFKREEDGNWNAFDEMMSTYFGVKTPSQSRPRYDILGYDLTRFFVPAVINALQAADDAAWQQALETEHDGLQSTLRFQRIGDGGFMNTPLQVVPRMANVEAQDKDDNDDAK